MLSAGPCALGVLKSLGFAHCGGPRHTGTTRLPHQVLISGCRVECKYIYIYNNIYVKCKKHNIYIYIFIYSQEQCSEGRVKVCTVRMCDWSGTRGHWYGAVARSYRGSGAIISRLSVQNYSHDEPFLANLWEHADHSEVQLFSILI